MFLNEFVGHAFGFPDCHPSFLGVAVLALGFQFEAFIVFGLGSWCCGGLRTG